MSQLWLVSWWNISRCIFSLYTKWRIKSLLNTICKHLSKYNKVRGNQIHIVSLCWSVILALIVQGVLCLRPTVTQVSSKLPIIPHGSSPWSQYYDLSHWRLPPVYLITILLKWASSAPPPPSVIKPHPATLYTHTHTACHTRHTPIRPAAREQCLVTCVNRHPRSHDWFAPSEFARANVTLERLNFNLFSSEPVSFDYTTPALRLHSLRGTGESFCYWLTFNWLQ